jgi:nucleoside 2-deoxyribosyltransferase
MKIYFAGSIRGGREHKELYFELIKHLQKYGPVLTEHVGKQGLSEKGETLPDRHLFDRDTKWLNESDVVIAEVSTPSLGVGYELGSAELSGKKVLCMYRTDSRKQLSAMIAGNPKFIVKKYKDLNEALTIIDEFFKTM